MAPRSATSCLALLALVVIVAVVPPPSAAAAESIYNVLQYYGFPPGLVPKDVVTRYDLNPSNGQFNVYLNTSCAFTAYRYDVEFKTQISGVIKREEIDNLHGVQVKLMNTYWTNLQTVEMVEDDAELEFSVGYTAADFPVYYFYNIPECGCGFDCGQPTPAPPPAPGT